MEKKDLEKQLMNRVVKLQGVRSKKSLYNIVPKGAFSLLGYNVDDVDLQTLKDYANWILRDYITFNRVVESIIDGVEQIDVEE